MELDVLLAEATIEIEMLRALVDHQTVAEIAAELEEFRRGRRVAATVKRCQEGAAAFISMLLHARGGGKRPQLY